MKLLKDRNDWGIKKNRVGGNEEDKEERGEWGLDVAAGVSVV